MFDGAEAIGRLSRSVQEEHRAGGEDAKFGASFILGGQIAGQPPELCLIYPEGNCIMPSPEKPFLQIGEIQYGKPILDRFLTLDTPLADAARCALVSLDSTMRSNLAVGPPIELALYEQDALRLARHERFEAGCAVPARRAGQLVGHGGAWHGRVAALSVGRWRGRAGTMTYAALHEAFEELGRLRHAQAILNWDEAVMMPAGGGATRAEALATLAGIAHRRLVDERIGEWAEAALADADLDEWRRANVREMLRAWRRARALPESLVVESSRANALCEQAWAHCPAGQ